MKAFFSSLSGLPSDRVYNMIIGSDIEVAITNHARSGNYILGSMCLEFNGNYYGTGNTPPQDREKGIIWKYDPTTDIFTWGLCYGNSTGTETIMHRTPSLIIDDNGYIYTAGGDPHSDEIIITRSSSPESITEFNHLPATGIIGGVCAYPSLYLYGNDIIISHRNTGVTFFGAGDEEFMHSTWRATIGVWSWQRMDLYKNRDGTNPDNREVMYPTFPKQSVNNEWEYLLTSPRSGNWGGEEYYDQLVLKTKDWLTFYNIEETASRNISVNGGIPILDRPDYSIKNNGRTKGVHLQTVSIVNDVFVGVYYDWDNEKHYIRWYDGSWHEQDVQTILSPNYGYGGAFRDIRKIGSKYYISYSKNESDILSNRLVETKIPFTEFKELKHFGYDTDEGYIPRSPAFPTNIDTIQKTILIGSSGGGNVTDGYGVNPLVYNIINFN